jgi:hypothetical protein
MTHFHPNKKTTNVRAGRSVALNNLVQTPNSKNYTNFYNKIRHFSFLKIFSVISDLLPLSHVHTMTYEQGFSGVHYQSTYD